MDPQLRQAPSAHEPPARPAKVDPPHYGSRLEQRLGNWSPAQRQAITTHVQRAVSEAPALTDPQRELLRSLLRPTTTSKNSDAA